MNFYMICRILHTSKPGDVIGFGRWSVDFEGFQRDLVPIDGVLLQFLELGHEPRLESGQHATAAHHDQILGQRNSVVDRTLQF